MQARLSSRTGSAAALVAFFLLVPAVSVEAVPGGITLPRVPLPAIPSVPDLPETHQVRDDDGSAEGSLFIKDGPSGGFPGDRGTKWLDIPSLDDDQSISGARLWVHGWAAMCGSQNLFVNGQLSTFDPCTTFAGPMTVRWGSIPISPTALWPGSSNTFEIFTTTATMAGYSLDSNSGNSSPRDCTPTTTGPGYVIDYYCTWLDGGLMWYLEYDTTIKLADKPIYIGTADAAHSCNDAWGCNDGPAALEIVSTPAGWMAAFQEEGGGYYGHFGPLQGSPSTGFSLGSPGNNVEWNCKGEIWIQVNIAPLGFGTRFNVDVYVADRTPVVSTGTCGDYHLSGTADFT